MATNKNLQTAKVFISYSRMDEVYAQRLFNYLKVLGIDVWLDKECLLPGQDWEREIKEAIGSSDFVALILSNKSIRRRGYFQKEVRLTLDVLKTIPFGHIFLLPIRIDQCEVPSEIAAVNYVDLFPNWQSGIKKIVKSIELQSGIQFKARIAEKSSHQDKPSVLLVNDQPATMNFVIDLWKSQGLKVDYAFDVKQGLRLIKELSPSVVVSDLSHYSFDQLVTDRAGFEILEWANKNGIKLNVIITTANLTEERILEAMKLGAVGICNNVDELNNLISNSTGVPIGVPNEIKALEVKNSSQLRDINNKSISLIFDFDDYAFSEKLVTDLINLGFHVIMENQLNINFGASLEGKLEPSYDGDIIIFVLSKNPDINTSLSNFIPSGHRTFWGLETFMESKIIIPVVIDDIPREYYPPSLRNETPINFSEDYKVGLTQLFARI
jgi:CheY-like chemotaxis protein